MKIARYLFSDRCNSFNFGILFNNFRTVDMGKFVPFNIINSKFRARGKLEAVKYDCSGLYPKFNTSNLGKEKIVEISSHDENLFQAKSI